MGLRSEFDSDEEYSHVALLSKISVHPIPLWDYTDMVLVLVAKYTKSPEKKLCARAHNKVIIVRAR